MDVEVCGENGAYYKVCFIKSTILIKLSDSANCYLSNYLSFDV